MPHWLPFASWPGGSFSVRTCGMSASEGVGEAEGDAVEVAVGVGELSGWGFISFCAESWLSSFHRPPSFTRFQTITNLGVPVLSTKETSTVAVAVVPITCSTVREWILELCISYDCSPAIQLASSC